MSNTIRATRKALGIASAELARRLGVTPSAVTQLEQSERSGTIKLGSLMDAHAALGTDFRLTALPYSAPMNPYAPLAVSRSIAQYLDQGDTDFAFRLLTDAASRAASGEISEDDLRFPPEPIADRAWDTLMRATYAYYLGERKPGWTATLPLPSPWYQSDFPTLRRRARDTAPDELRALNLFVDAKSLSRA